MTSHIGREVALGNRLSAIGLANAAYRVVYLLIILNRKYLPHGIIVSGTSALFRDIHLWAACFAHDI